MTTYLFRKLDMFIKFLEENNNFKYILRSYLTIHKNGTAEFFGTWSKILQLGQRQLLAFQASVTSRDLLFQEVRHRCNWWVRWNTSPGLFDAQFVSDTGLSVHIAFSCCTVISWWQAYFGSSNAKNPFTPGSVTESNSINFIKATLRLQMPWCPA